MKKTILIVEDNPDIQNLYTQMLSEEYNTLQVTNTKDAWKTLAKEEINLIILDIILPKGAFGDKFYAQISQHPGYQDIPVVFVSVIDDPKEAGNLKKINNAHYIEK
ncbi:MAG: response regulator, partial [Candidatus Altiarchaeales archaeon]|nr:response regulator [Candidatus Altiarchaeales archaeon]